MKILVIILFHLFLITWHGYFVIMQMEDFIGGYLKGKSLFIFLLRVVIMVIFSISFWKITKRTTIAENEERHLR